MRPNMQNVRKKTGTDGELELGVHLEVVKGSRDEARQLAMTQVGMAQQKLDARAIESRMRSFVLWRAQCILESLDLLTTMSNLPADDLYRATKEQLIISNLRELRGLIERFPRENGFVAMARIIAGDYEDALTLARGCDLENTERLAKKIVVSVQLLAKGVEEL